MPSSEETRIVKQALLDEAAKWSQLSADMSKVQQGLDGLELMVSAFFTNNLGTAQMAKSAYDGVWHLMTKLAGEAATEFNQINEALRRAYDRYEEAEGKAVVDLTSIYGK